MSLALAIDQITKGTWWNDSPEPWKNNRKVLSSNKARRDDLLEELRRIKRPMSYPELAESNDCGIASIRNLAQPMIAGGKIRRVEIAEKIYLEAVP